MEMNDGHPRIVSKEDYDLAVKILAKEYEVSEFRIKEGLFQMKTLDESIRRDLENRGSYS